MPGTPDRSRPLDPALPPPAWAARVPGWAWLAAFVAATWLLRAFSRAAATGGPGGLAVAWPASGLALYALLVARRRHWPALLAAGFVFGFAESLRFGRPLAAALVYNGAHLVEGLVAWWVVVGLGGRPTLRTLRGALVLMFAPAAAIWAVSALSHVLLTGTAPFAAPRFWLFWAGSSVGILFVTTLLVAWSEPAPPPGRPGPAGIAAVLAALACAFAVLRGTGHVVDEVVLLPPLLWAAVQFGARGATVALVAAGLGLIATGSSGGWHAPVASPETYALSLQLLLTLGVSSILAVAAVGEERRAAEQRRVLLERAMDQSPDPAAIFDEDGTFVWANEAAARQFRAPRAAVVGTKVWSVAGGGPEAWRERWDRVASAGAVVLEDRLPGAAGDAVPFEVSAAIVDDGSRRLLVSVLRDLSDRRRAEESSRLAALGTLAAGVAHEINNPLSYVVSNLAHVRERVATLPDPAGALRADVLEPLAEAQEGALRVRDIVRQLGAFARADVALAPVDPGRALRAALAMARNELRHRARLTAALADTPPVHATENRLVQVFLNLLVNAAQAIPEGNVERNEVRVSLSAEGDDVVAVVSDTGAGMDAATRARIFEPFFTTKGPGPGPGTGLGLAISHSIVSGLGGRIEVESEPGAGSRFRVILPAAKAAAAEPSPAPPSEAASGAAAPGPRRRVLVVDDDPLVARALARMLQAEEVVTEDRAPAALARIRAGERFDAVVCDLMMPELSGMDLHAVIAELDPAQAHRMLFVTGGVFTDAAREFLERVPNPRLEKPVDRAALADALRRLPRRT